MPGIPRLNVFPEIRRTTREPPERHTNTSKAELSEDGSLYSWSDPIDSDSESKKRTLTKFQLSLPNSMYQMASLSFLPS